MDTDKLGQTLAKTGKMASDKAKNMAEIMSLKNQIKTCEEVVEKNYRDLGKLYYESCGDTPDPLFAKHCRDIRNAAAGAEQLKNKVKELKTEL